MNKKNYMYSILLLLSVSYAQIGFSKHYIYRKDLNIESEQKSNNSDNNKDIELSKEDQQFPAQFPINYSINTLGSVTFNQTYSYTINFNISAPIHADELIFMHTLPFEAKLISLNEDNPQTRSIICNGTPFSVCVRRNQNKDTYKICLINNQTIDAGETISLRIVVRAPRVPYIIVSKTRIQAAPHSNRLKTIEAPIITINTNVRSTVIPISKADTTILEVLSA